MSITKSRLTILKERENTYIARSLKNMFILSFFPQPHTVTFTTTTSLELPNPKYLKLHAAVCRIAHLSGVAADLDSFDGGVQETSILRNDGTSADLLASRLQDALLSR